MIFVRRYTQNRSPSIITNSVGNIKSRCTSFVKNLNVSALMSSLRFNSKTRYIRCYNVGLEKQTRKTRKKTERQEQKHVKAVENGGESITSMAFLSVHTHVYVNMLMLVSMSIYINMSEQRLDPLL